MFSGVIWLLVSGRGPHGVICANYQPLQATIWLMLRFLSNTFLVWQGESTCGCWSVGCFTIGLFHHEKRLMFVNLHFTGSYCCYTCWYGSVPLQTILWANRIPPTPLKTYSSAVFECPRDVMWIWYFCSFAFALPGVAQPSDSETFDDMKGACL